jgi:Na+/phosphate symporter
MTEELRQKAFRGRLQALCPLVDNLRLMLGAARHAFNRHSRAELAEMARLREEFTLDIDPFFQQVDLGLEKGSEADKPYLSKLQGILTHLEIMAEKIGRLSDPIRQKSNHGAIFSDRAFFHINDMFSRQTGLMRGLVDIFQQDDASLKEYVLDESQRLSESCFQDESEHDSKMMDNPGQPESWSIYLNILDLFGEILGHLLKIVTSLR